MFFRRQTAISWDDVRARIAREFPDVPQVSAADLAAELALADDSRPVLLDVRDEDEYAISHLPGARHVLPKSDPREVLADVTRERRVIAYCAAGIRSCRYLERMSKLGYTNVANLDGAIFQWANEDRPLEAGGQAARLVHGCDARWSALLREDLRVLPS